MRTFSKSYLIPPTTWFLELKHHASTFALTPMHNTLWRTEIPTRNSLRHAVPGPTPTALPKPASLTQFMHRDDLRGGADRRRSFRIRESGVNNDNTWRTLKSHIKNTVESGEDGKPCRRQTACTTTPLHARHTCNDSSHQSCNLGLHRNHTASRPQP
jgi:hypothetical protein